MDKLAYGALILSLLVSNRILFAGRSICFVLMATLASLFSVVGMSIYLCGELTSRSLGIGFAISCVPLAFFAIAERISLPEVKRRLLKISWVPSDTFFLATFLFMAALICFIVRLNPAPPGNSLDAAAHFAIVRNFLEFHAPPGAQWSFLWEIAFYPFGFHANAAILSQVFNVQPTLLVWVLPAFLICFCVAMCSAMIWEFLSARALPLREKVLACGLATLLLSLSPYTLETVLGAGFYPMSTAMFIVLVLTWATFPRQETNLATVLLFLLCLSFIPITYPQWGPFLCLYFAALVYKSQMRGLFKIASLIAVALPAGFIGLTFILKNWSGLSYIFQVEGWSRRDPIFVLALFGSGVLGLASFKEIRKSNLTLLLGMCLLEAVGLIAAKSSNGAGAFYHLYKFAYVLVPLMVMLAFISTPFLDASLAWRRFGKVVLFVCFIHAFGRLNFSTDHSIAMQDADVFLWAGRHIDRPSIGIINTKPDDSPYALWAYALSGKPSSYDVKEWWAKKTEAFDSWLARAAVGDVAVARGDHEFSLHRDVRVLYSKGVTAVVQKVHPIPTYHLSGEIPQE